MRPLTVAILFVGLVSLVLILTSTNVFSLLPEQHKFVNIATPSNDINCEACHSRIRAELDNSAWHKDFNCTDCHRFTGTGITFAEGGSPATAGEEAHAAYTPRCLDCHGGNGVWIGGSKFATPARAFNLADYGSDVSAHKPLVKQSLDYNLSVGENEACIACHTNYSIKNVFKRPEYFDFWIKKSGGSGSDWYLDSITYGDKNTTNITKSESGAKHEFKAINQIKCEDCHLDVWQAANNITTNNYGSYYASHVCWKWENGSKTLYDEMHDVSHINVPGGYDNITEYCLLSCHKPTVKTGTPPVTLTATVHAARRLSCYDCHTDDYIFSVYNKPGGVEIPGFKGGEEHGSLDDNVLSEPLFLNAETCIACKRAGVPSPSMLSVHFQTYTEPNNRMYYGSMPI